MIPERVSVGSAGLKTNTDNFEAGIAKNLSQPLESIKLINDVIYLGLKIVVKRFDGCLQSVGFVSIFFSCCIQKLGSSEKIFLICLCLQKSFFFACFILRSESLSGIFLIVSLTIQDLRNRIHLLLLKLLINIERTFSCFLNLRK